VVPIVLLLCDKKHACLLGLFFFGSQIYDSLVKLLFFLLFILHIFWCCSR
jgi:hypothetical protein